MDASPADEVADQNHPPGTEAMDVDRGTDMLVVDVAGADVAAAAAQGSAAPAQTPATLASRLVRMC